MIHRLFPKSLLSCISEARQPCAAEAEGLAAKIWREALRRPGAQEWHALPPHSPHRRRALAAAYAAMGRVSGEPSVVQHPKAPRVAMETEKPLFPWPVKPEHPPETKSVDRIMVLADEEIA